MDSHLCRTRKRAVEVGLRGFGVVAAEGTVNVADPRIATGGEVGPHCEETEQRQPCLCSFLFNERFAAAESGATRPTQGGEWQRRGR